MDKENFLNLMKGVLHDGPHREYYEQMLHTIWRLSHEDPPLDDVKLINTALKELRYTSKVLSHYKGRKKITVFGSARTKHNSPLFKLAVKFGQKISEMGYMVITGGGPGIMEAANLGAGPENSFGFNIRLPFEQSANPVVDEDLKLINFKYFFTRKLAFVKEADALALFPGGFGTHDEAYEVLTLTQTGKSSPMPIVMIDHHHGKYWKSWKKFVDLHLLRTKLISKEDFNLFKIVSSVEEACEYIHNFYSNYHSQRYVKDLLVIRMHREIPQKYLKSLNAKFKDIIVTGHIEKTDALDVEKEDGDYAHLKRIKFNFNRKNYGKLYRLIAEINKF